MFDYNINMYIIYDKLNFIAIFNLGDTEKVESFFNSIASEWENKKWGSIYPTIMNEFYKGKLEQNHINNAIYEIKDIKKKLKEIEIYSPKSEEQNNTKKTMSLDDKYINNKNEKMTDTILKVLESAKNKKMPLYIGEYQLSTLDNSKLTEIISKNKKKQIIDNILKYTIYLLIVIIVKLTVTKQLFNEFIIKFVFFMIVAELINLRIKKKIKSLQNKKQKETNYR